MLLHFALLSAKLQDTLMEAPSPRSCPCPAMELRGASFWRGISGLGAPNDVVAFEQICDLFESYDGPKKTVILPPAPEKEEVWADEEFDLFDDGHIEEAMLVEEEEELPTEEPVEHELALLERLYERVRQGSKRWWDEEPGSIVWSEAEQFTTHDGEEEVVWVRHGYNPDDEPTLIRSR